MDVLTVVVIGLLIVGFLIYCVWRFLTTDWLGIYHDDPTMTRYYKNKSGRGRK